MIGLFAHAYLPLGLQRNAGTRGPVVHAKTHDAHGKLLMTRRLSSIPPSSPKHISIATATTIRGHLHQPRAPSTSVPLSLSLSLSSSSSSSSAPSFGKGLLHAHMLVPIFRSTQHSHTLGKFSFARCVLRARAKKRARLSCEQSQRAIHAYNISATTTTSLVCACVFVCVCVYVYTLFYAK